MEDIDNEIEQLHSKISDIDHQIEQLRIKRFLKVMSHGNLNEVILKRFKKTISLNF